MDLEALNKHPQIRSRKERKRVGRGDGSGHGKTSGRGHKGAKSRSGWTYRYFYEGGQMPLTRRIPKRGFSNAGFRTRFDVINVSMLNGFEDGTEVDAALLREKGLIKKKSSLAVKVLGDGELTRKLIVRVDRCTSGAREKIEAAGGEVVELMPRTTRKRRRRKKK